MSKRKSSKSALVKSLFCMVLCVGLLVGATFAWFSDEAKTGDTQITAGNLDVQLLEVESVKDNGGQTPSSVDRFGEEITDQDTLFDISEDFLWEPGAMWKSKVFAVKNAGSLTLQYTLTVKVEKDPEYTGDLDLSERIKMKFAPAKQADVDGQSTVADTQEARKAYWDGINGGNTSERGVLRPGLNSIPYVAVLYWEPADSTAVDDFEANPDNRFNLDADAYGENGENAPGMNFSLDVFATQYPDEEDSFGPNYDAGIVVATTTEELEKAIEGAGNGDIIELDPSAGEVIKSSAFGKLADLSPDVKELTIAGVDPEDKAVVDVVETSTSYGGQQYGVLVNGNTERTVTFSNLTLDGTDIGDGKWGGVVGVGGNANVVLENVEIIGGNEASGQTFNACVSKSGNASVTLKGCTLTGATRGVLTEGTGDVLIEDCIIEAKRPLYRDSGSVNITVKGGEVRGGRSSFSADTNTKDSKISFENVTFKKGSARIGFPFSENWVASYWDVTFTGCTFEKGFKFSAQGSRITVNFDNGCTLDGQAVTNSNASDLLGTGLDYLSEGSDENVNLTVEVDGTVAKSPAA